MRYQSYEGGAFPADHRPSFSYGEELAHKRPGGSRSFLKRKRDQFDSIVASPIAGGPRDTVPSQKRRDLEDLSPERKQQVHYLMNTVKQGFAGAPEHETKDFCHVLEHEIIDIIQVFSKERKHRSQQVRRSLKSAGGRSRGRERRSQEGALESKALAVYAPRPQR